MKGSFIKFLKQEKRLSNHTVISYETDLNQFKSFFSEYSSKKEIESADKRAIRSWIVELSLKNLSPKSINRKIATLKSFYKFLVKREIIKITQTNELGIYEVYNNGKHFSSFPTRLHYNEYPQQLIDEENFKNIFPKNNLRWISLDENFNKVFSETRHGKSLWNIFLILAIIFLLIETILSAPNTKKLKVENFDR